jgi:glutathione S-transferase
MDSYPQKKGKTQDLTPCNNDLTLETLMTLKLCGFSVSNYYSKLKLQLLEKNVPFEEELVWVGNTHPRLMERSPMGKVPFIETPDGCISESMACAEYIEQKYPQHALLPADPFQAGKVRELIVYLELHLELVARELYAQAFFGGTVSDETKERVRKQLTKGIAAFSKLAKFTPYVAGSEFTLADCAAVIHLPLVSTATKRVLGEDMLAGLPVKEYVKRIEERPTMQRVNADRKVNAEEMAALRAKK